MPLLGSSVWPPSRSWRTQVFSFSCWLSELSPAISARSIRARRPLAPLLGLAAVNWFSRRIVASMVCGISASCGRQALVLGCTGASESIRAGDSSSASWKSLMAAK